MKSQFLNTELEMRLLCKRDPRSAIAASNINLHGGSVRPLSNTEHHLNDINEEKESFKDDFSSYAFYIEE